MSLPPDGHIAQESPASPPIGLAWTGSVPHPPAGRELRWLDEEAEVRAGDPGSVILTCANCGAEMIERKCKLICRCGYFLSCSDYY